jgi:uncharacterized membrane protein
LDIGHWKLKKLWTLVIGNWTLYSMLRKNLPEDYTESNGFRWRGHEVSRIEDFSDSVFAITIALLLVSVEVPDTFEQLSKHMKGFIGFSFAFAFLIYLWHAHYLFFRRFGFRSVAIIWLNGILLFLIMFYSYPLKFLINLIFSFSGGNTVSLSSPQEFEQLMVIYGLGMMAIFLLLIVMYRYALNKKDEIELNAFEILGCKAKMVEYAVMVFWGTVSVTMSLSLPYEYLPYSGMIYFMIGPSMFIAMYFYYGKKLQKLMNEINQQ